jgi:hypothetical protein
MEAEGFEMPVDLAFSLTVKHLFIGIFLLIFWACLNFLYFLYVSAY